MIMIAHSLSCRTVELIDLDGDNHLSVSTARARELALTCRGEDDDEISFIVDLVADSSRHRVMLTPADRARLASMLEQAADRVAEVPR